MRAIGRIDSYRPDNRLWGHRILPQQWLFDLARSHPSVFLGLTRLTNPLLEGPSRLKGLWKKRFHSRQPIIPTGVRPHDRYPEVNARKANGPLGFDQDFHSGVPTGTDPGTRYGTYAIARALGFSDDQARRLGRMDNGVDDNTTPYGKTSPYLMGQEDRHFNLAGSGEDTRLVWARRHLEQAIAFGRATSYDQAEVELGAGLHSLQDLFAHGQLTPSVHAVLGDFPDDVTRDPIAVVEATRATAAYLKVYLQALE